KDHNPDQPGDRLLLPIRLTWHPGSVLPAATSRTRPAAYVGSALGHGIAGALALDPQADPTRVFIEAHLTPQPHAGPRRTALADLAADGQAAYWEALTLLGTLSRGALHRASYGQACELGQDR